MFYIIYVIDKPFPITPNIMKTRNLNAAALEIINDINLVLRSRGIKDIKNELFDFGCRYLLRHNMYHGYNFFKWEGCDENGLGGRLCLAGSCNPAKYDCLQIYISASLSIN